MKKDISFIITFSVLSQILIILNSNNTLYLSNILSLIGFSIMISIYPLFFYNKYNWILNTNIYIFNIICLIIHFLPIYIFRNKQNINKNNIDITIINTLLLLLFYYLLFKKYLQNNLYPLNETQLLVLIILILSFLFYYYKSTGE